MPGEHPRIVAVKEASANMDQLPRSCAIARLASRYGRTVWTLPIAGMGGEGVSACSNESRRDSGDVRRGVRGRLGHRSADPRALAAALEGQLHVGHPVPVKAPYR